MKILIATMPFSGHFNPLTGVAARLLDRGHEVAWYTAPSFVHKVERLGVTAFPYRRAIEVTDENIGELYPERAKLRGPNRLAFDFDKVFAAPVRDHFLDIREIRDEYPFELLVCDAAFFAATIVARALHVPVYAVNPGPSVYPASDVPPPFFGLRPARGPIGRVRDRIVWRLVYGSLKLGLTSFNDAFAVAGLPAVEERDVFRVVEETATRIFQAGVPETDFPRSESPPNTMYVGALLPQRADAAAPLDPRITAWSGPLVVVSQGTVDNRDLSKLIAPTIEALAGGDTLVVAVTAGSGTAALRRRYPLPSVIVEDFIDFHQLFQHADVFVCNGGHGSVMLALQYRVPLLLAGTREGKNDINARLAYNGVAVDLRTERPSPKRIAAGVARVLADRGLQERAREIGGILDGYDSLGLVEAALAEDFPAAAPQQMEST
ncbi:glycosyltransferase family 1 protein [Agromyces sp. ISL-38]|uniref:glycosyltransferase n=1 Tax=Agromyces sp. ISL-38 TaxID=2819107 RepID=UPI001BECBEA3|nr:glycosyltransferase [Agromyces sp. ISL-38]MBT2499119.1 glycosyltransferase family 1 protein [Agromyces sp. ISL-38]